MPFLYFLRDIANPFMDFLFALITHLGEETLFLVLAILIFWCIDKRQGYYVLIVGLVGTVVNQFAKLACRVPRPWVLDPEFQIVESAREEATGYSFPSGHTQNIAGTFGSIAAYNRKNKLTVISVAIITLVAFSRMYLGVHTPLDVGVSIIVALLLIFFLRPVFETEESFKKLFPYVVVISTLLCAGLLIFAISSTGDTTLDPANLHSALKNGSTLFGCTLGLILVYFVDCKYVNFITDGKWYAQLIKIVIGLVVILGIKSGLSAPLEFIFVNEFVARAVRYFLIVAFAGAVWPLTFAWFSRLRIASLDRFGEKVASIFKKKEQN